MMSRKNAAIIASAVLAHALLFYVVFAVLNFGLAVVVSLAWSLAWVRYCDDHPVAGVSYAKQALIGGPLCWIFHPTCMTPAKLNSTEPSLGWRVLTRTVTSVTDAALVLLRNLRSLCA